MVNANKINSNHHIFYRRFVKKAAFLAEIRLSKIPLNIGTIVILTIERCILRDPQPVKQKGFLCDINALWRDYEY